MALLFSNLVSALSTPNDLAYVCLSVFLAWRMMNIMDIHVHRPGNILIAGGASIIGEWMSGLHYTFFATHAIGKAYKKTAEAPYALPTADHYLVLLRSKEHIEELDKIPEHHVSFHTAMTDRVFHKYTMNGFEYDKDDPYSVISTRALRIHLRSRLPDLQPTIQQRIEASLKRELSQAETVDGWRVVRTFPIAKRLTGDVNASVIVGEKLASDPAYFQAATRYAFDAAIATELLRFTPRCLVRFVGPLIMWWSGSMQQVVDFLTPVIQDRLSSPHVEDQDCLQWLIELSRAKAEPSVPVIAQKALGFIFAFAHQIAMSLTFAIHNLCRHPEYLAPLRQEIQNMSMSAGKTKDNYEELPLLDSFLKESARKNPLDSLSMQRRALLPYTFADGTHIPVKTWIAAPQRAMMEDPAIYPNPDIFDGFRFVDKHDGVTRSKSRFTHPAWSFPYWGSVRRSWYMLPSLPAEIFRDWDSMLTWYA